MIQSNLMKQFASGKKVDSEIGDGRWEMGGGDRTQWPASLQSVQVSVGPQALGPGWPRRSAPLQKLVAVGLLIFGLVALLPVRPILR